MIKALKTSKPRFSYKEMRNAGMNHEDAMHLMMNPDQQPKTLTKISPKMVNSMQKYGK